MNIHKNARTTPRSRGQIVERVLTQQERPPAVAAAVGVSDRTVRKWLARYAAEAAAGLADRSCRPRRSPRATPPLLVSWVEHLRRQRWAGAEIAQALQLSASTVARLLRRQGLARLRQLEPPVPVQRYEWAQPGDLLHLDVKKLGRIGRVGHRITGDRRAQVRGIGWEFVHVAVDDASRLAYVEVLPDEGGVTATQFLWRARAWFRRHGIRVRRVLTDNGSGYVSDRFARLCRSTGVRHLRTRPYTPRTNGKAERFIQTLLREWAYRRAYSTSRHRTHVAPPHRGAARLAVLLQLGAPAWRAPRSSAHHLLGGPEQSRGSSNLVVGSRGHSLRIRLARLLSNDIPADDGGLALVREPALPRDLIEAALPQLHDFTLGDLRELLELDPIAFLECCGRHRLSTVRMARRLRKRRAGRRSAHDLGANVHSGARRRTTAAYVHVAHLYARPRDSSQLKPTMRICASSAAHTATV